MARLKAGPALRTSWADSLAAAAHPPGMLPDWQLGVVLDTTETEARVGVLELRPGDVAATQAVLPMFLADLGWARPRAGERRAARSAAAPHRRRGAAGRRGDGASRARGRPGRTRLPERLLLRQIPQVQGALVSLDPTTGRVLALAGGWSYEMSQFNRATQAERQPGSSFKPFVYLTALEQGISPSQRFLDAPFVVDLGAQGKWRPGNYERDFMGPGAAARGAGGIAATW